MPQPIRDLIDPAAAPPPSRGPVCLFMQSLPEGRQIDKIGNNSGGSDLVSCHKIAIARTEQKMRDRTADNKHIDRLTSASICNAIGERLRQNFRPDPAGLPSHLQNLLDQMAQQDRQTSREKSGS